jgi:hypothetical protein
MATATITIEVVAPSVSGPTWPIGQFGETITDIAAVVGGPDAAVQTAGWYPQKPQPVGAIARLRFALRRVAI